MNYMENGGSCKNSQWGGCLIDSYTEIRISNYKKNTNPNDTEANASGRSGNGSALCKHSEFGIAQVGWGIGQIPRSEVFICGRVGIAHSVVLLSALKGAMRANGTAGGGGGGVVCRVICNTSTTTILLTRGPISDLCGCPRTEESTDG